MVLAVRVFLAIVFSASALSKRQGNWPLRLAAYGIWSDQSSMRLARGVVLAEVTVAAALVAVDGFGLLAAGTTLVSFASVLIFASAVGYRGDCGCSPSGRVSRTAAARARGWGILAIALGLESED